MKLSLRGEYALRALIVLGQNYGSGVVRIHTISEQQNIPQGFLAQILNDLKSGHFVESRRGVAGGYRLARPPEEITLAPVIRHIEGALAPVSCVSEKFYKQCTCPNESFCAIKSVMTEVRTAILGIVERVSVADLCERTRDLSASAAGGIDYAI
jgi:Rrf2 family protein